MSKLENVEGKFFIDFPTLKKHESGMLEIIINNYTVQLENQAQGNSIILLCDNKDLNIPNKFDKDDRNEALLFYKHIIDAVLEKANYDNSLKVEEKELPKRICTGEPIPSLSLENDTYKIITNDNY